MSGAQQLSLFGEAAPETADPAGRRKLIQLGSRVVDFRFTRTRRRTIGVAIDATGLSVTAPRHAPWIDIESFMREKSRWILAKLDEWAAAGSPVRIHGITGESLPYWGRPVTLAVHTGAKHIATDGDQLVLRMRAPEDRARVRAELIRWLKLDAMRALKPRAAHYAGLIGRLEPELSISNARTQWGVCMEDGRIRLSWRLVHLPPVLADYVVAHEIAHLLELNHSRRFWAVVERLYPDYREARRQLDLAAASLPVF